MKRLLIFLLFPFTLFGQAVTLSQSSVAFGSQAIYSYSTPTIVTMTNSAGSGTLTWTSITFSANYGSVFNWKYPTPDCQSPGAPTNALYGSGGAVNSLAPGASCTIGIDFQPTAVQSYNGTVTINDNASGSPHVITLTGTGTAYVSGSLSQTNWLAWNRAGSPGDNTECFQASTNTAGSGLFSQRTLNQSATCASVDLPTPTVYPYTTGGLSQRSFNFTFGTVTFVAKFPGGNNTGSWPDIWLLDQGCQNSTPTGTDFNCNEVEVDIAEWFDNFNTVHESYHVPLNNNYLFTCAAPVSSDASQNYHTYQFTWTSTSMTWFVDGTQTCTTSTNITQNPMFLQITSGAGGTEGGTIVPSTMPWTMNLQYVQITQNGNTIFYDNFGATSSTVYVSQGGGTVSGGVLCNGQNSVSLATFNGTTYTNQSVVLCGALFPTTAPLTFHGTDSTLSFDVGARISFTTAVIGTGVGFQVTGNGNTIAGQFPCGLGTTCNTSERANPTGYTTSMTGIIEVTNSGTAYGNGTGNAHFQMFAVNGTQNTVKNLIIRNGYIHTSVTDTFGGPQTFIGLTDNGTNVNGMVVENCEFHDEDTPFILNASGTNTSNITYTGNDTWNYNWGFANGTTGTLINSNIVVAGNHFGSTQNWDDNDNNHHHDYFFIYGDSNDQGYVQGLWLYDNLWDGQVTQLNSNNHSTAVIYISGGQPTQCYIYNNVFNITGVNPDDGIITANGTGSQSSAVGCFFINNTIIGANINTGLEGAVVQAGLINFVNNIVTEAVQLQYLQNAHIAPTAPVIQDLDYNAYCVANTNQPFTHDGTPQYFTTLAAWQTFTGAEAHSTYTPAGCNLSSTFIPLGAPAEGAGQNLTSLCSQTNMSFLCFDTTLAGTVTPTARPTTGPWDVGARVASTSGAIISVAPTSLAFGNVSVGSSALSPVVTVSNTGNAPLSGLNGGLSISNTTNYSILNNTCSASIAAGSNCTFQVQFAPQSAGSLPATVTLVTNAQNGTQSIPVSGNGVAAAITLTLTPATVTYSPQLVTTTSAPQTITLTNTGSQSAALSSWSINTPTTFTITATTCSANLAAGASCTYSVTFTPPTVGNFVAGLTVNSNAATSPNTTALSGQGFSSGQIVGCQLNSLAEIIWGAICQ